MVLSVDKQMLLINTVVKSVDQLVDIMKSTNAISEEIHQTITEILKFLGKVMISLPEILVSEMSVRYRKQDLLDNFDILFDAWIEFLSDSSNFYDNWLIFSEYWKSFEKSLKTIEKSGTTIFLSLN